MAQKITLIVDGLTEQQCHDLCGDGIITAIEDEGGVIVSSSVDTASDEGTTNTQSASAPEAQPGE